MKHWTYALAGLGAMALGACATEPPAREAPAATAGAVEPSRYEQDRQAILAMTGTYRVRFDFTETVPIKEGYEPRPRKVSGGDEVVFVVEDRPGFISLQHILVMKVEDEWLVTKHWRQDWAYEPEEVMTFLGRDRFGMRPVPAEQRRGAWSQTVYQVDDSPRYGGYGAWRHEAGASTWESNASWRPLPRRDDTTRSDYDVIAAVNRHTITPWGWSHEQDNSKLVLTAAGPQEIVREVGINSYRKSDEVNREPADAYWSKTAPMWEDVRAAWSRLEADGRDFVVDDDAVGSKLYMPVLEVADRVEKGEITAEAGGEQAAALIRRQTGGPAAESLAARQGGVQRGR